MPSSPSCSDALFREHAGQQEAQTDADENGRDGMTTHGIRDVVGDAR